jgi:hypothetical protein
MAKLKVLCIFVLFSVAPLFAQGFSLELSSGVGVGYRTPDADALGDYLKSAYAGIGATYAIADWLSVGAWTGLRVELEDNASPTLGAKVIIGDPDTIALSAGLCWQEPAWGLALWPHFGIYAFRCFAFFQGAGYTPALGGESEWNVYVGYSVPL